MIRPVDDWLTYAEAARLLLVARGTIRNRMSQHQLGPTFNVGGVRVDATEYQLWKNAFVMADKGETDGHYEWIYGAAAFLAGIIL